MPRYNPYKLSPRKRKELLDDFFAMVALLEDKIEAERFLKDLLSESEAVMLARRIQVAKLLLKGFTFEQIRQRLGVGPTTVASVHKWLRGGFGGYFKTIEKQKKLRKK
jgi:TrpR-related protein YerC/YecD